MPPDAKFDIMQDFGAASDPMEWEYDDIADVYYRSPSDQEIDDYGWDRLTLLVLPDPDLLSALAAGDAITVARLPEVDREMQSPQANLSFVETDLELKFSHSSIAVQTATTVTAGQPPTYASSRPTFHHYLTRGVDWQGVPDVLMEGAATPLNGAVVIRGVIPGQQFQLEGPLADHYDLVPEPPVKREVFVMHTNLGHPLVASSLVRAADPLAAKQVLEPSEFSLRDSGAPVRETTTPAGQCDDGLDNDPDGCADAADFSCAPHNDFSGDEIDSVVSFEYSRDFGLYGDMQWCTANTAFFHIKFALWAFDGAQILNWIEPPAEFEPLQGRPPPFKITAAGCFFHTSLDAARKCHWDEDGCPSAYVLEGVENNWSSEHASGGYLGNAWEYASVLAENMFVFGNVAPLNHVVLVAAPGNSPGPAGKASLFLRDRPHGLGAAVFAPSLTGGLEGPTVAHEMLHNYGFEHDNITSGPPHFLPGIMSEFGARFPDLDWEAASAIEDLSQGDVWRFHMSDKTVPRPKGFRYTGCEDDDDCDSGHPGLTCQGTPGAKMCL